MISARASARTFESCYELKRLELQDNSWKELPTHLDLQEKNRRDATADIVPSTLRYNDWEHYCAVNVQLLREEALAQPRHGLIEFRANKKVPKDIPIYLEVIPVAYWLEKGNIYLDVRIPDQKVSAKRLWYGSLVYILEDKFLHAKAKVVESSRREPQDDQPAKIQRLGTYTQVTLEVEDDVLDILSWYRKLTCDPKDYRKWPLTLIECPVYHRIFDAATRGLQSSDYPTQFWNVMNGDDDEPRCPFTKRTLFSTTPLYPGQASEFLTARCLKERLTQNPPKISVLDFS